MPPQASTSQTTPTTTTSSTTTSTSTQDTTSRSSTSTTSTTSSSSSDSRSSSSSSSTSTTTSTSSTSTTRATPTTTSTTGNVVTSTSTMFVTSSSKGVLTPTNTVGAGGSTSFLQNTGAVAAVFTLVGIVGLSLIFILARNFHRRRQQEAFDRELQEATRDAAATSTGPFFDDDDDDPYKSSYRNGAAGANMYGSGERQFSDMSHGTHGTYSQPPLSVDSYGMREISHPPGEMLYSSDPYSAGAAGIGVARARSMRAEGSNVHQSDYSSALKDGNAPYPAFAAPNPGHMPGGIADPYATGALAIQHPYAHGGSYSRASVGNRSVDGSGQHYHNNGYGPSAPGPAVPVNRYSVVNEDTEDAYGGVADGVGDSKESDLGEAQVMAPLPNPFERDLSEEGHTKEADVESVHSQEEQPKRVLKVANE